MNKRPNILFLMNDHQLYYRHGWDGGVPIQRPHFDRLAAQGIEFKRAYTVCPLCTPARRSILTSLFPHTHGQLQNRPERPFRHQTYLTQLAHAGYDNYYFGKWHAGAGTAADFGCQGYSLPGYGNPYTSAKYKTYLRQHGIQPPTIIVERDFAHENRLPPGVPYQQTDEQGCWEHMSGIMDAPEDAHEAFFLANLACDQLEEIARSGRKRPFSLRIDFWSPHQPYFPTPRFARMYNPADIPVYGNFYDELETKPSIYQRELNYPIGNKNGSLIQPNPLPWSEW
ncbi:MAG: sulfatase-like hydrolase/transferase [Chloroflexota bacterium]